MTHLVGVPPRTEGYFPELPTRIRVSITSLQICKLVSLVTSSNRSRVSFLICKSFRDEASQDSEQLTPQPPGYIPVHRDEGFHSFQSGTKLCCSLKVKNHILALQQSLCTGRLVLWNRFPKVIISKSVIPDPSQCDSAACMMQAVRVYTLMTSKSFTELCMSELKHLSIETLLNY